MRDSWNRILDSCKVRKSWVILESLKWIATILLSQNLAMTGWSAILSNRLAMTVYFEILRYAQNDKLVRKTIEVFAVWLLYLWEFLGLRLDLKSAKSQKFPQVRNRIPKDKLPPPYKAIL